MPTGPRLFNSDSILFVVDCGSEKYVPRITSIHEIACHWVASNIYYAVAVTPERVPDLIMRYGRVRSDPRKTGLSNYILFWP